MVLNKKTLDSQTPTLSRASDENSRTETSRKKYSWRPKPPGKNEWSYKAPRRPSRHNSTKPQAGLTPLLSQSLKKVKEPDRMGAQQPGLVNAPTRYRQMLLWNLGAKLLKDPTT